MSFSFNGNTPRKIIFNNQDVKKLIYNNDVVWEKKRLPVEYQEVEYIESTGTQYIDTGISSTRYITAHLDMQFTEYSSSSMIIIAWSTGAGRWFGKGGLNTYSAGNDAVSDIDCLTRKEIEVTFTNSDITFVIDGTTYSKASTSSQSITYTMFAGRNVKSGVSYYSSAKLYKATIQENGLTIRDFIPCYRKIDKKPGLYDAFNDVFYTNDGTGEFNVGADIITLPADYQRVEYIQGKSYANGANYIDTLEYAKNTTKMELVCEITGFPNQYERLYGVRGAFWTMQSGSTSYRFYIDKPNRATLLKTQELSSNTEYVIVQDGGTTYLNGTQIASSAQTFDTETDPEMSYAPDGKIWLNAVNGGDKSNSHLKIKSCIIWQNGVLTKHFIPCYRKIDNVAGLYDVSNDVFYTNAGSGEFDVGPEINALPTEYQKVEYIQSSGKQYIQTSVTPNDNFRMHLKTYTTCGDSYYCAGVRASNKIWFGQTGTTTNNRVSASVNGTSVNASTDGVLWSRSTSGQTYEIMLCTNGDGTFTYHIKDLTNNKESLTENREYTLMGEATNGVCLFALNRNYIISGTNQVYYFRLYKNGKIAFDGIPCYRKSDEEIGLYDLVSKQLYTNQGTGTFTKGPDVN